MKKNYPLFIMLFFTAVIFSCGKNTNSIVYATPVIAGKWYFKESTQAYYVFATLNHIDTVTNYTALDYVQLNSDGTGVLSQNHYGLAAEKIKYNFATKDSSLFLYQYVNTDSAYTDTFSVTGLNSSKMSWHASHTQSSVDFSETEVYDYYFSK